MERKNAMRVGSVGYNYRHEEAFIKDCPNGCGCWLMLLIKEPSVFDVINKSNAKNTPKTVPKILVIIIVAIIY